jgi:predicted naringenin-chalcone synthase
MTAHMLNIATGTPGVRYPQDVIADWFAEVVAPTRGRALRTIFKRSGVGFRNFTVGTDFYREPRSTAERNAVYVPEAVKLGTQVIEQALRGHDAAEIDDFIVVSCTGYITPGLDLRLAGQFGMRPDLQRSTILSMGCYGAFPGLRRAWQALESGARRTALVLALELCSLHLQFEESSEGIITSALFSDGAAAALLSTDGQGTSWPAIIDAETHCDYNTLDHMTFTLTDHGFRMSLSSYVPDVLAAQVEVFINGLLQRNGLTRGDVAHWGIHPGSTKIVDHVQERLGLNDRQVESAHAVLHEYGNMSSATILFVLDHIQRCAHPEPGDYGVLMAFGPGLTMESLLVRW